MKKYNKALSEVDVILKNMPNELANKIPNNFKNMVNEEKDKNYNPKVNDLVIKENLLPETIIILGLIYRDYLCSKKKEMY